jgi:hypothetical protein
VQKESFIFKFRVLPLVLLSCCAGMNQVQASDYLPPRLSVDANAGGSATVGQADLLLSLKGDERRNLYLDPQAAYGTDEQWYADLGLGYRWIQNDAAILGGYLFAGHSQVANQSGFWIANPGVEALGSRWDARINGYIPVAGRSNKIAEFRPSSRFVFSGHIARLVTTDLTADVTQQIGDGVDAKVAYQIFRGLPLKAYLGGYFFAIPNANNVRGGAAGVEYWMDRNVKVFANYTCDNLQHSTVVGGLAVSFGGVDEPRADPSLSERLSDPVERYLANLGHGSGIPSEILLTNMRTGQKSVLSNLSINNIPGAISSQVVTGSAIFFSQLGTPNDGGVGLSLANCTFENPCGPTDFSQTGVNTLNSLLPSTVMFFNAGTYPATNGSNALTLNNGQGVFGRTANYSAPASEAARPTFNGAFILNGNNTLDSIILNNSLGVTTPGSNPINNAPTVFSNGGQNILINNSNIGNVTIPGPAIFLTGGASATLTSSNVSSATPPSVANSVSPSDSGVISLISSSLVVQSSSVNLVNNVLTSASSAYALYLSNNSSMQFNGSQINAVDKIRSITGAPYAVGGVRAADTSLISIENNSNISVTSLASSAAFYSSFRTRIQIIVNNSAVVVSGDNGSVIVSPVNNYVTFGSGASCILNSIAIVCA